MIAFLFVDIVVSWNLPKPPLVAFKFFLPFLVAIFPTPSPRFKKQKSKKKKVVLYRINILLFNKDIYVIRNFALGRCWPEKSRFLWDLTLASPGALNLLWKEVAVTFTTGEWGLWCGKGVHGVILDYVEWFLPTCFRCCLCHLPVLPRAISACPALEFLNTTSHPSLTPSWLKLWSHSFLMPDYLKKENYKTKTF